MRNTIEDKDKLSDKMEEDDKKNISEALKDGEEWLKTNGEESEAVDIEGKLKEI